MCVDRGKAGVFLLVSLGHLAGAMKKRSDSLFTVQVRLVPHPFLSSFPTLSLLACLHAGSEKGGGGYGCHRTDHSVEYVVGIQ